VPPAGDTRLRRIVEILEALGSPEAARDGGLGVVRVAELVGREKSLVSRALGALAAEGLVERDPRTRRYRLGWRLFGLVARVGHERLTGLARPVLRALVGQLGETAHLSVLDGRDVVTLLSEASPRVVRAISGTDRTVPAACTSSGRALLIDHELGDLRARFGDAALPAPGPQAPRSVEELHQRILAARARGFAIADAELARGHVGVAAPIRDAGGSVVAALNVSAPRFRIGRRLERAGVAIAAAAEELSRQLGGGEGVEAIGATDV
jgi:IclR family KDG regulon transcriptional repressor